MNQCRETLENELPAAGIYGRWTTHFIVGQEILWIHQCNNKALLAGVLFGSGYCQPVRGDDIMAVRRDIALQPNFGYTID